MQGIYIHIPDTNPVPKQYKVAAVLSLPFMVPISLAAASTLMHLTSTLSAVCVQCPIWQFSVVP
jgi:hypothetical protein